jgi:type III secretion protein O
VPARYPLQDLLRVRVFREDNAQSELTAQRKKVVEAEQLVEQCKTEVVEFHAWRLKREDELYEEIIRQQVQRNDLDDLRAKIEGLRAEELAYEQKVLDAETALKSAREKLVKAHAAWQQATRDREKISEHREQWMQEEAKESENNAEKELEDFRVREPEEDAPAEEQDPTDDVDPHFVE